MNLRLLYCFSSSVLSITMISIFFLFLIFSFLVFFIYSLKSSWSFVTFFSFISWFCWIVISFWLIVFISVCFNQFSSYILSSSFFSFSKLLCNCFICNSLSKTLSILVFVILLNTLTSLNVSFSWWGFISFVFVYSDILVCSYISFMLKYFLFMPFFYFSISFYLLFRSSSSINIVLYLLFQILCSWLTLSFLQISCISSRQSCITFSFVVLLHLKWNHLCQYPHCTPVSMYLSHFICQFSLFMACCSFSTW